MPDLDIDDVFNYHALDEAQQHRVETMRVAAKDFARAIVENTPRCADQSAAIRKVREALHAANAAVALKGRV